jgi:hypothetical protein
MSRKVRALAHPDAVRVIGEMVVGLVKSNKKKG